MIIKLFYVIKFTCLRIRIIKIVYANLNVKIEDLLELNEKISNTKSDNVIEEKVIKFGQKCQNFANF